MSALITPQRCVYCGSEIHKRQPYMAEIACDCAHDGCTYEAPAHVKCERGARMEVFSGAIRHL